MTLPTANEDEVIRWFAEGRSYVWMGEQYERQYNIRTKISLWGNYRRRNKIPKVLSRLDRAVPWNLQEQHRWTYAAVMLHAAWRERTEADQSFLEQLRLRVWRDQLAADDLVVDYDPASDAGFSYVQRRPGIDLGLIREPGEVPGV